MMKPTLCPRRALRIDGWSTWSFLLVAVLDVAVGCDGSPGPGSDGGPDVVAMDHPLIADDAGMDVEVGPNDAPSDRAVRESGGDACISNCTGRTCGLDPLCGASCGTCAGTEVCNASGQCQCMPICGGRTCGPDPACGVSCGTCGTGQTCIGGTCTSTCVPMCSGRTCGPDGCGGSCGGSCPAGQSCSAAGHCTSACVPACDGTSCGADGCGGTCACTVHTSCDPSGSGNCVCDSNYVVNAAATGCVPVGGSCAANGVTANGYCAPDGSGLWVFCDPSLGIETLNCGLAGYGACHDFGGGVGACTCTGMSDRCGSAGGRSWNILFGCNTFTSPNAVYEINCGFRNPRGVAQCAEYSTSFGTNASCMCAPCDPYYPALGTCESSPACSPATCAVTSSTPSVPALEACL